MPTTMEICSSAIRGLIVAPPNKKLVIADLSNIEGRVLAWLAGENWKLKAFSDFDKGIGTDLYILTYSKTFGVPVAQVTKSLRQIGKVMELAFGYQGGVGAWITFAGAYGIDLEEMASSAKGSIPPEIIEEAQRFLLWTSEQKRSTYGLSNNAFIVCDSIKRMWRYAHPAIGALWKEIETACIDAVDCPGETYTAGLHKIVSATYGDQKWLTVSLPSRRRLAYPEPQLLNGKLTYMGMNQYTRKWSRLSTYGGKLVENITQAVARDVLAHGMVAAEQRGYEIVLTVHDEILAETPDSKQYNVSELSKLMSAAPKWAMGLPLAAAGFETYRYKKD